MNKSWFNIYRSDSHINNSNIWIELQLSEDKKKLYQLLIEYIQYIIRQLYAKYPQKIPKLRHIDELYEIHNDSFIEENSHILIDNINIYTHDQGSIWSSKPRRYKYDKLIINKLILYHDTLQCIVPENNNIIPYHDYYAQYGINCRYRLVKKYDKYYLVMPKRNIDNYVGIDPGILTFLTCTDNNRNVIKIGTNICSNLKTIMSKIISIKNSPRLTNYKKKKGILKCETKIKNKIHELHNKSIILLVTEYKNIRIGNFGNMCWDENEYMDDDIRKYLRYDIFLSKLKKRCEQNKIGLTIVNENLTSKICSGCSVHNYYGTNYRIYRCNNCGLELDRDINASINILNSTK